MTDAAAERPRPQFGEYATREEQLAHIKEPSPEQINPTPVAAATPAAPAAGSVSADVANEMATDADLKKLNTLQAAQTARLQFNLVSTIAFLVYGLIEVVINTPSFLNFGVMINDELSSFAESSGKTIDTYTATAVTQAVGYGLIAFWIVLWVAAALWSWRRLQARKVAIWIPFLAGVIANLTVGVCIAILVAQNPVILHQLVTAVTGGA